MLVICCGMPRSASTWQYRVVRELLRQADPLHDGGWVESFAAFAAAGLGDRISKLTVVVKTHAFDARFAELLQRGRAHGFHTIRDVRDVVLSHADAFGGALEEQIRDALPAYLRDSDAWRREPGVVTQRYERIVADPVTQAAVLAAELAVPADADDLRAIDEACGLAAARRQSEALVAAGLQAGQYEPRTLLHPGHVRDGRAGRWRLALDPEQVAKVERVAGEWLSANGYLTT